MSDEYQARIIRTQSSAVVSAALITTMGAVTAACIQSGWIARPTETAVALSQPLGSPTGASFMQPDRSFKIPVLPPQQPAKRVTADKPIYDPHATVLQTDPSIRRPMGSDGAWTPPVNTLAQQDRRMEPKKSGFKLWDWSAMTRFLFGTN